MENETQCAGCLHVHPSPVDEMPVEFINELLERWAETAVDDWSEIGGRYAAPHPLLGRIQLIEFVGGAGLGDHTHLVWQIGDRLIRKDGYYGSYDGFHFDGRMYEVQRREKTVTVYE